ncbi:MAG: aldo/keto reductase, partial [Pseudomonadota bacterium]
TNVPHSFKIGGDLIVNRLGYGAMRLTGQPGNFGPFEDWAGGLALLRRAADLGIDFFDSAFAYGTETADRILGEALENRDVVLATKGGVDKRRSAFGETQIMVDGSRAALHAQIERARINLRRDRIDLFQLHRIDPAVPVERSVEALAEAQAAGWIRHIGLSNVTLDDLERARSVAPIASVQNRFNMAETDADGMVDHTAALGIAFIPYGPLGAAPMAHGAKLDPQDALAWLLKRSPNIVVIPGTTKIAHLEENWRAWERV